MFTGQDLFEKNSDIAYEEPVVASSRFTGEHFSIHPAVHAQDTHAAYRLVYREYFKRRYCPPNESQLYYTPFCFLPFATTFVLKKKNIVHGTISLVPDSIHGLPMDCNFKKEADEIRSRPGSRPAEVCLLAIDDALKGGSQRGFSTPSLSPSFILFKSLFTLAHRQGITDLLITVLPRQENFYEAFTFRSVGIPRPYQMAYGTTAIAMTLNIPEWLTTVPEDNRIKSFLLS